MACAPASRMSTRWTDGYERVAEQAAALPATRRVYVADRESDIMALMVKAKELGHPADWLLRSQHNRTLPGGGKLWDKVTAGEPVGRIHFTLAARQAQPARAVRQQVWAQRVALPDAAGGVVSATCIVAREVDPPAGVKPIEWRLLSNREVDGLDAAVQLIDGTARVGRLNYFFMCSRTAVGSRHCNSHRWHGLSVPWRCSWWWHDASLG